MELFRISEGPWEKLFQGKFQEHEFEIYSNPDKLMLVLVFEKKLDRVEGAIAEIYKVFHAEGDIENFIETLPREVLIVTKHDENSTLKFFLLGAKPIYARWVEDEFIQDVDSLIKKISTSAMMIKDVSKAYELTLNELKDSTEEVKSAFFTQPLMAPIMTTARKTSFKSVEKKPDFRAITKGEIELGLTREKNKVEEPLALMMRTIVSDGNDSERERVIKVLSEGAMLSNVPVIVIDFGKKFFGLGQATDNRDELQKYNVESDPLGFPVKTFLPGDDFKIDLNLAEPKALAEIFGVGDKDFPRIMKMVLEKGKISSVEGLIEKIGQTSNTEEFSEFSIQRTARIIKLISIRNPKMFGGENNYTELIKKTASGVARASILDAENLDEKITLLLIHSIAKGINSISDESKTSEARGIIVVPKAEIFKIGKKGEELYKSIINEFGKMGENGFGFFLSADKLIDVGAELREFIGAKLNIVSGNDVGVQLKNRKAYRVLVRPTLSREQ